MTKANPLRNVFNGGQFSILVEGRVDIDRYPASMRKLHNFVASMQGPVLRRSGSEMITPAASDNTPSLLIPFERSATDVQQIEFSNNVIRFITEDGLQLNNDGTPYTVASPYTTADLKSLRYAQSVDVLYLFCAGKPTKKLSRYSAYDWRLLDTVFIGGPYLPELKRVGRLNVNKSGIPTDGSAKASSYRQTGGGAPPEKAFDAFLTTSWYAQDGSGDGVGQTGTLAYISPTARVITGYTLYQTVDNVSDSHASVDYAPKTWTFEVSNDATDWNNGTWTVMDKQNGYLVWDDNRSVFFPINNDTAYKAWRISIQECYGNGTDVFPAIALFTVTAPTAPEMQIDVTQSGQLDDVNRGQGFLTSDVGRLIRMFGSDNRWRNGRIVSVTDNRHFRINLLDEPFPNAEDPILRYQLGAWSMTTGYATCGMFYDDRLWTAGSMDNPDVISASLVSSYEDMSASTSASEVLDTSAIFVRLNSRRVAAIQWMLPDDKGVLIGTGTSEWVVGPGDKSNDSTITARNIKATPQTDRGSAAVEALKVDKQGLYVQATGRTVREYAYDYTVDGFKSQSMSLFASDLGTPGIIKMAYASEPYSVVWVLRADGVVCGLTYDRDQKVVGWHTHDFGGFVEDIATLPSPTDKQDCLWLVVRRTVNGATRRFVEKTQPFWDFGLDVSNAWFVDCGRRYVGPPTDTVSIPYLAGETVTGVVDGVPFYDVPVALDGTVKLRHPGMNIVAGIPFVSEAETTPIEAGASIGTAQGKSKRVDQLKIYLWDTARGEIGVYNEDQQFTDYQDIDYRVPYDDLEPAKLYTQMIPATMPGGYGLFGTVSFRQTAPLPFNVISIMPDMVTNDG